MGFQQLGFLSIPQGTTRLWWQVVSVILNTQGDESYFRKLNHPSRLVWFPQDMPVCQCKLLFGFVHFVILAAGFGLQFNASLPPGLIRELIKLSSVAFRYQLNKMVVDTNAGPYGNQTVLFLGSSRGTILKFLVTPNRDNTVTNNNMFLEELEGYNPDR